MNKRVKKKRGMLSIDGRRKWRVIDSYTGNGESRKFIQVLNLRTPLWLKRTDGGENWADLIKDEEKK